MAKSSAGVLLFREREDGLEVLLVHPGGPLWARKDDGAWSIPKGELEAGEDSLEAARREFREEIGYDPEGPFVSLPPVRQAGGKTVHVWAARGDFDPADLKSNLFGMEWPPRSGRYQEFPEVDRASWYTIPAAERKILAGQAPMLRQLVRSLEVGREHGCISDPGAKPGL